MNATVAGVGAVPPKSSKHDRVRRPVRPNATWLVIPGVAFLTLTFVFPIVVLLSRSVYDGSGFTLA